MLASVIPAVMRRFRGILGSDPQGENIVVMVVVMVTMVVMVVEEVVLASLILAVMRRFRGNLGSDPPGESIVHPMDGKGADFLTLWDTYASPTVRA